MDGDRPNPRCKTHPRVLAGWQCKACEAYLCPACTERVVKSFYCCLCREPARQITTHRSRRPYVAWLGDVLGYPLTRGLIPILATAALLAGLSFAVTKLFDPERAVGAAVAVSSKPLPAALIYPLVRALVVFMLVVFVAARMPRKSRREPMPYGLPFKSIATTLIVWTPAAAYLLLVQKGLPDAHTLRDPLTWLHLGLAAVFLPVAVLGAAADNPWREIMNPFRVFGWAWNVGGRYWLTLPLIVALAAGSLYLGRYLPAVERAVFVPGLATVVAEAVALLPFAMLGRLVGWVLHVHGEAFDWGAPADYQDPVLQADATGIRKAVAAEPDGEGGGEPADQGAAVREKPESSLARDVILYMEDKNFTRAIKIYMSRDTWTPTLFTDRQLFDLGTAAVRAKKPAAAERIFLAGEERGGLMAPRTLLALASLYEDARHEPEKAAEIYRRIVEKFPKSDQARVAARKLEDAKQDG
jgi:hypothetical protein